MRRLINVFFIVTIVLSSGVGARRAHAANAKADALVNQAVELRRNGDDEGALSLLLQAYGLGRAPRTAGQLGLCEQALGRWADAETYLTEALKAESDPWVKKNRRTLEDALAVVKSHIARIEIQGEPEGAEIWVNGGLVGKLPLAAPVRVSAGEVEVELRAPGFVREARTMRLEAGAYQRVVMRASKQPAAPPPAAPVAQTPTPASTTTVVVNVPESREAQGAATDTTTAGASNGRLALKWVAWGLGAVGVGVGVYGAVANSNSVASFGKTCGIDPASGKAIDRTNNMFTTACANAKSDYESKTTIAVSGFVAAGALVVTGLVLWLTEPSSPRAHDTAFSCAPTLGANLTPAAACGMRF